LGNWVHEQRKKFKRGILTADQINLLSDLQFEFTKEYNVVGDKLMMGVAISKILKYKKDYGNMLVPNRDHYKQLHRWITHAKYVSKKIIQEWKGNPKFTLPLNFLNELSL
jgi:hypothetical protein